MGSTSPNLTFERLNGVAKRPFFALAAIRCLCVSHRYQGMHHTHSYGSNACYAPQLHAVSGLPSPASSVQRYPDHGVGVPREERGAVLSAPIFCRLASRASATGQKDFRCNHSRGLFSNTSLS